MKREFNGIGNHDAIPNNYKFVHLAEKIEVVLNADNKLHHIVINAKTDINLRRYYIHINEKALYENFGIEVDEYNILGNTICIYGTYTIDSLFLLDKYLNTDKLKYYNDRFNIYEYELIIDNDNISHIAVAEPLSKLDNVEIHYHDEDKKVVEIHNKNNVLNFESKIDIWLNTIYMANIIDLNLDISIPDDYVLQIFNSNNSIRTGVSIFNAPYNILDGDKIEICLKWIGSIKTLETNKYEIEKNGLGQIDRIKIPAGTVIAQAIMIERKPIKLSYY